jgi:hypothetical protein
VRIPAEQFSDIPAQVLSPAQDNQGSSNPPSSQSESSLCVSDISNCAGSAPNTPKTKQKVPIVTLSANQLVHEQLNSLPAQSRSYLAQLSPHLVLSKYFKLPKMIGRQWSMIYNREKLEGFPLLVCTDCMDMVNQVSNTTSNHK